MRYFDTHAHIGLISEDPIEQLLSLREARQAGIKGVMSICNNPGDFFKLYETLSPSPIAYFAIGVSPSEVRHPGADWESLVEKAVQRERVVALGEIGLDYYKKFGNKTAQIELFVRQLELADYYDLPVIIHNREAGKDILDILKTKMPARGGVFHCFSGSLEEARRALDTHENLYISFAGNVTYGTARQLQAVAREIEFDRIVIESESPFMPPARYREKRNRPYYLPAIVDFLSEMRGIEKEELSELFFWNALKLFGLEKLLEEPAEEEEA